MVFALKDALDDENFHFAQLLIWIKNHAVVGRLDYLPMHELICYGWFGKHRFRKSKDKSLLYFPKPNKGELHATMKPVGLIRTLILNSTEIGEIIYDGYLGSGTAIIAAEHTKRRCFGMEIDLDHCQTIIKRYEKLTGQSARKEANG
jgi:DNA modification methylase